MNWDAIGAIGEIVGALAVVISLVYLATQIRIQNRESRLAAVHDILVGFRESIQAFGSVSLGVTLVKGNDDWSSLTDPEIMNLLSGLLPMLRLWEEAFIQYQNGRLENRIWKGINSQYSSYLNYPSISKAWELRGHHFDSDFQRHVNSIHKTELKIR